MHKKVHRKYFCSSRKHCIVLIIPILVWVLLFTSPGKNLRSTRGILPALSKKQDKSTTPWNTSAKARIVSDAWRKRVEDTLNTMQKTERSKRTKKKKAQKHHQRGSGSNKTEKNVFQSLRGEGFITLHNLCIELDETAEPIRASGNRTPRMYGEDLNKKLMESITIYPKKLVVYGSPKHKIQTMTKQGQFWKIHHRKSALPKKSSYRLIKDYPAYFVRETCLGNLHHFWAQTAVPLFGVLQVTNRLNSTIRNQVYYIRPVWFLNRKTGCHGPSRYQEILFSFGVRPRHDSFHLEEANTCYQNAVLQEIGRKRRDPEKNDPVGSTFQQAIQYLSKHCSPTRDNCRSSPVITIIQRLVRTIANAEELRDELINSGVSKTVNVYIFEHLPLKEQIQIILCTDLLIGVHGAGLEWIHFLQKGKALLELAWPDHHWPFFCSSDAKSNGLVAATLAADRVDLNWTAFEQQGVFTPPLTEEKKQRLAEVRGAWYNSNNPWKYADGVFNKTIFKQNVIALLRKIQFKDNS